MNPRIVMPIEELRAKLRAGEPIGEVLLRKQYIADSIKAGEGDASRKVIFTISTGAVDRDYDTIAPEGWKLENFQRNPVVLWAHNSYGLPIARAENVGVEGGVLRATAEFVPAEDYPFAETVLRMLKGGFLNATSVGYLSLKRMWNDERGGIDFLEQELLEFSVVPVPANPEALQDAKRSGIDLAPLKAWAERTLDEIAGEPGLWLSKAQATAALKVLTDPKTHLFLAPTTVTPAPAPEGTESPVLYLAQGEPTFGIDPKDVIAVVQATISEAVREHVNRARGRLED